MGAEKRKPALQGEAKKKLKHDMWGENAKQSYDQ